MNIFRLHISARTQSRRQETLPLTLRPQPQPDPAGLHLGACDCARINDLRRYLPDQMQP